MTKTQLGKAVYFCLCTALMVTSSVFANGVANRDSQLIFTVVPSLMRAPQINLNPAAEEYVSTYIRRHGQMLEEIYQLRGSYFKTIDKVFTEKNIPIQMKYLAVIESKLKTTALSKVGARGMWQLMPGTARALGLKVNGKVDERIYFYKSTVAAAEYLQDLYAMFDDWLLTVAAYNSGPGHVLNAIKKTGSRNFWVIQYHLPQETRFHVKKFIATHYYFEGGGSITTLTKAERMKHLQALDKFMALNSKKRKEEKPAPVDTYIQWVAVVNQDDDIVVFTKR